MNNTSVETIIASLKSFGSEKNVEGMKRYGIVSKNAYGVSTPVFMRMSKEIGKNHSLALKLWRTGIYDARVLAFLIEDANKVTEQQMERWVKDFDNWAICDGCCLHLFDHTRFVYKKIIEWTEREEEFVKRAGFTLIATRGVHDKLASDDLFTSFLSIIEYNSCDERKYVMKAVNWALRQIGKRNIQLNKKAIRTAQEIQKLDSRSARWIASDALRELKSDAVQKRLLKKTKTQQ